MRKILTILLLLTMVLGALSSCGDEPKSITGNEWLVLQKDCIKDLEAYAKGMDDVYVLYITEAITAKDFSVELNLLKQQYSILVGFYDKMKDEHPIKPESHSYISKRGSDAVERLYKTFGDILDNSVGESGAPIPANQLSYTYLAYRQTIIDDLVEYMTALSYYEASINPDLSTDFTEDTSSEDSSSVVPSRYASETFPGGAFSFSFKSNDMEVIKGDSSVVLLHPKYVVCITLRKDETHAETVAKAVSIIGAQTPHSFDSSDLVLSNSAALPGGGKIFTGVMAKDKDRWNQVYAYKIAMAGQNCSVVGVSIEKPLTIQSSIEMQENIDYIFASLSEE